MKLTRSIILSIFSLLLLYVSCSKPMPEIRGKPTLRIKIRDDTGGIILGVKVKLYKHISDTGLTKITDSTGLVIFPDLDTTLYYWLAEKGCKTNRVSQTTLNYPLVPGSVHYGYSILTETGALKIINNSAQTYIVSDSLINFRVSKDTPYFAFRNVRSYLIHCQNSETPGVIKDTLVKVKCTDTTILVLPF